MKPRLRKSNPRTMPGVWVCSCDGFRGYGDTPLEAYEQCMRWANQWPRNAMERPQLRAGLRHYYPAYGPDTREVSG